MPFMHLESILDSKSLFISSIVLISTFFLSPLHLTKLKAIKVIQKFCIGIGAAFLFWWIWTLTDLIIINFLYFIAIFGILLIILNGYHASGIYSTCKKCQYSRDWKNCPGFEDYIKYLKENNLPNIFLK